MEGLGLGINRVLGDWIYNYFLENERAKSFGVREHKHREAAFRGVYKGFRSPVEGQVQDHKEAPHAPRGPQ